MARSPDSPHRVASGFTWTDRLAAMPKAGRVGLTFIAGAVGFPLIRLLLPGGSDQLESPFERGLSGLLFGTVLAFCSAFVRRKEHAVFDGRTDEERLEIARALRTGVPPDDRDLDGAVRLLARRRRGRDDAAVPSALGAGLIAAGLGTAGVAQRSWPYVLAAAVMAALGIHTILVARRSDRRLDELERSTRARDAHDEARRSARAVADRP